MQYQLQIAERHLPHDVKDQQIIDPYAPVEDEISNALKIVKAKE